MRKTMIFIAALMLATPIVARAMDDLMPASSEDLEQFDRAMAVHQQQQEQRTQKKDRRENKERQPKRDNFGQRVSTEAQRLKESGGGESKRGDSARWSTSNQRRQSERTNSVTPDRGDRGGDRDRGGDSGGRGGRRGGR